MLSSFKLSTFNCRGLGNAIKRKSVFQWLKNHHKGLCFLQETHSSLATEDKWQKEWNSQMYLHHGTSASKGVAILFPKSMDVIINNIEKDKDGRILIIDATLEIGNVVLVNVYFPTKDSLSQQLNCLKTLTELLEKYNDKSIIMGGDFNIIFDHDLDKIGGNKDKESYAVKDLKELMNDFNLIDIWRTLNPNAVQCTRRQASRSGLVQTRLDFWLISTHMLYDVDECTIAPGLKSDHSIVNLTFNVNEIQPRGRGFFKFNSMLLKDKEYVCLIKETIAQFTNDNGRMNDKAMFWDCLKCMIRGKTISYASHLAKKNKQIEMDLLQRIDHLEKHLDEANADEYRTCKAELENIYDIKSKGLMTRTKAIIIDADEKPTNYFLNQEINNYKNKHIRKLIVNDKIITDAETILQEEATFYKQLYSSQQNVTNYAEFANDIPRLKESDKVMCDQNISEYELSKSLSELSQNKTPGSDGLSAEFYKFFWPDIKQIVLESFQYAFEHGILSIEQRRGILNIIPKKDKDLRYLKNWRPISLLNTDYKILTKLLAKRLQQVIPSIVSPNQTGYIKNRYIGENIRILTDITQYTAIHKIPAILLQLDFEKAFDSVSWSFMHFVLKKYNFGPSFRKWIEIIYNQPEFCVTNNGYHSSFLPMSRGIRQGCPISSLLFVLVVETMALNIRNNDMIKGVTVENEEFKISQLADDTTLFLKDIESVKRLLCFLSKFSLVSGLKLNQSKTEAVWIGKNINCRSKPLGLKWNDGFFKCLGIWCHSNVKLMIEKNYNERIDRLKSVLNKWKQRKLSLKGKITILWSIALPQLLYVCSTLYTPRWVIEETDKIMFNFLWTGKKSHVKKSSIIAEVSEGGLRMIHFESMVKAIKTNWIRRLRDSNSPLITLVSALSGFKLSTKDLVMCFLNDSLLRRMKGEFYCQIFLYWNELHTPSIITPNMLYNQILWYNSEIVVDNESIWYASWSAKGINRLSDIMKRDGSFKDKTTIENQYHITVNQMEYNSLVHSISSKCKKCIQNNDVSIEPHCITNVKIEGKYMELSDIKCKQFYRAFTLPLKKDPTAISKWCESYDIDQDTWKYYFMLPFNVCIDTELQTLQYKIIHRFFPCNYALSLWFEDIQSSCQLTECIGIRDTLQHYFFHCSSVSVFWNAFMRFWRMHTGFSFILQELDVIFGILNPFNYDHIDVLNYCIIYAKSYIYKCKRDEKKLCFFEFLILLKNRMEVMHYLSTVKNKENTFLNKWSIIYKKF